MLGQLNGFNRTYHVYEYISQNPPLYPSGCKENERVFYFPKHGKWPCSHCHRFSWERANLSLTCYFTKLFSKVQNCVYRSEAYGLIWKYSCISTYELNLFVHVSYSENISYNKNTFICERVKWNTQICGVF